VVTDVELYINPGAAVCSIYFFDPTIEQTWYYEENIDFANTHYQWSGRCAVPEGFTVDANGNPWDITVTGYQLLLP
jgi:hypothetical protein